MGTIVRKHAFSDGEPAKPNEVNDNETVLYNEINGNLDWDNILASLINAANGFVKLDASGLVPTDQVPDVVPSGVIVMWAGLLAAIPAAWSLCDGTGGTPDLRDKFIYGWTDAVDPGGTGGATTHTHGVGTLAGASSATHTHSVNPASTLSGAPDYSLGGEHRYEYIGGQRYCAGYQHRHYVDIAPTTSSGSGAHTHTISGITAAGSTLPPYYKLAFIQKD